MARYFFHIHDGVDIQDQEGVELPDWRAAQVAAMQLASVIIEDHAKIIMLGDDWSMEIADDSGLILFRLEFYIRGSPALIQRSPPTKHALKSRT